MTRDTKILDEYTLKHMPKSLVNSPETVEIPEFSIAAFYFPLQDSLNLPEDNKYGGDSFSVKRLDDGRIFIVFRNGVEHGQMGRTAINHGNSVLEEILSKHISEENLLKKIINQDMYERLDLLAFTLNELLACRYKRPALTVSSTLIAGTDKDKHFKYVVLGNSAIFVMNEKEIKNEDFIVGRNPPVGSISVEKVLHKSETFYPIKEIQLSVGDKIIMVSDGVYNLQNKQRKTFGLDKLKTTFQNHIGGTPSKVIIDINREMARYKGDAPMPDDYTILILERKG